VTAIYLAEDEGRQEARREVAEAHPDVVFERVDLTKSAHVVDLFDRLAEMGRSPELLVNAAGLETQPPTAFLNATGLGAALDLSLLATFLTCQQAVKAMAQRRFARIINFASPSALQGGEGQVVDAAAKAGVLGLTRALAREVDPFGITVNAVCAGAIRTERTTQATPSRRAGTADEVAGMVNMLCEDGAGYITGQCLSIDGGLT